MELSQLVQDEQRFRSLFENNPDLVQFQDQAGTVLDMNPSFLRHLRLTREQVLGHWFNEFLPEELRPLFTQKLKEAFQGHKVRFDVEVQFVGATPPPPPVWLSVSKVPLITDGTVTGVHMVARDVTELFASHRIIQEQAHRLNTIFESITDAFFLLDEDFRFTYVNGEVERLLNVTRQEVINQPFSAVSKSSSSTGDDFGQRLQQAMHTGQAVHFETYYEQTSRWLEVKAFPSEAQLSVYFSDVTEKVRSQEDMYRQHQDLQQFTYIVSHNLRAPLANALGLVDLLGSVPPDSPDHAAVLDNLKTSMQQLDAVLRDMNTILSVRDRQEMTEPAPVALAEVVEQVRQNLQEPLPQGSGEIVITIPAGLRVRANRAYLHSIFFNLLSNAMKYRAAERPLHVEVLANTLPSGGVEITVADNGSGFDLARAGADVFRLYKRFHSGPPGRGVGLYLVKGHVEAMGGTIAVHSTVGVGTRFVIYLP